MQNKHYTRKQSIVKLAKKEKASKPVNLLFLPPDERKKTLLKKARVKYMTNGLVYQLNKLEGSPLKKAYMNTFFCNNTLSENKGTLIADSYCKNRWCMVCSRIRTANLINGYLPQLKELPDKQFLTLTLRTVPAEELSKRIDSMLEEWRRIMQNSRNQKVKILGIRKLECTSRPGGLFHPHFHFIISGREQAEWVRDQWLKRFPRDSDLAAQDLRPADDDSVMELFKYFTKLLTKTTNPDLLDKGSTSHINAPALDIIFQAMRGRRVYQPFGVKKVSEDIDELTPVVSADYKHQNFHWLKHDWIDTRTGELLSGWIPTEKLSALIGVRHELIDSP